MLEGRHFEMVSIVALRQYPLFLRYLRNVCILDHGTIIRTGITCKKIPCYMRDSACRWLIVKKTKIF